MTVSLDELVDRIRFELGDEPWQDYLTGAIAVADLTVTLNAPTSWSEGDFLEIDDGKGELVRVLATPSANPVSVRRAVHGTQAQQHASGAYVFKNPEYEYNQISQALSRVCNAQLWPYAWAVRDTTITLVNGTHYYALPLDFMALVGVSQKLSNTGPTIFQYGQQAPYSVHVQENVNPTDFGSGRALYLPNLRSTASGFETLYVKYAAIPTMSDIQDGLWADTVCYGACAKLMAGKEAARMSEDTSMGDTSKNPGSQLRSASWYKLEFEDARLQLNNLLSRTAPLMKKWSR